MNKKIIIPLALLVAIIPAIGLTSSYENDEITQTVHTPTLIPHTDKIVSHADFDTRNMSLSESVDVASLIIKGTVLSTESFEKKVNPEHNAPWVFTVATVQISEVLKGDYTEKTIKVQMLGGETDARLALVEGSLAEEGEEVIMLLNNKETSIFAPNYNLITQAGDGMYTIQENEAVSYNDSKSMQLDRLIESISKATQR